MKILGVSPAHDSSVCIYEDGNIVSFYKEERLTRQKRDEFPLKALSFAAEDLNTKEIDGFAFCSVEDSHLFNMYQKTIGKFFSVKESLDLSNDHHLQHASLAFYNSQFKDAAVIVIDRNGSIFLNSSRESETIFFCEYPHSFRPVYKSFWVYENSAHTLIKDFFKNSDIEVDCSSMYGIVKVYESATSLIRQDRLENGKTMGLAAYGEKNNFPSLFFDNTNIPIDAIFTHEDFGKGHSTANAKLIDFSSSDINLNNYKKYADYAHHVQNETQNAVAFLVEKALEKTGTKNIVLTGGYALNVVCNHFLIKKFPNINFYFEPIADDSGNSIGGAMLMHRILTKDTNIYPQSDTFIHGRRHDLSKISGSEIDVAGVAELLINGKSVAVYEGLAEGGPRALGHRSILYYPKEKDSKDIVNKIKKREWYRPFAAAVLEQDIDKYFEMINIKSSPYMTISFPAKQLTKKMFPGIVHVDGSCRIQTVSPSNKTLFDLLNSIKQNTGHGIVLNTSFNLAGEPLVETPEDALQTLQKSHLDYLWFPEIGKIVE